MALACDFVHHNYSNIKMALIAAHFNTGVIRVVTVYRLVISLSAQPPPPPHPTPLPPNPLSPSLISLMQWFQWTLSTMFTYLYVICSHKEHQSDRCAATKDIATNEPNECAISCPNKLRVLLFVLLLLLLPYNVVVDRFYIAQFSALEQIHCARM